MDHQPLSKHLVRRARRMADRHKAELGAKFVEPPEWEHRPIQVKHAVEANLRFAEDLGARVERRQGKDVAATIAQIVKDENVASVVIGRSSHGRWHEFLRGSVVSSLLRKLRDVDVHVIADTQPDREPS